jgi:transposase
MSQAVVTDELWARLEPLLPVVERRQRYTGRLRADNRRALEGILCVLRTGISWQELPTELFGVSGSTSWRRLAEWQEAGIWQQLHENLLAELRAFGGLDLSYACVDGSHIRALKGGT